MIQYQILQTNITRIVWQTVRRISIKILGVNELKYEIVHTVYHGNFVDSTDFEDCDIIQVPSLEKSHAIQHC